MTTTIITKALQYLLVDGYSVFPVGKDKKPLIAWAKYQKELPTEVQVKEWWTKYPYANIGIATGKISGISVIDIDTYKTPSTPLDRFPKTLTVRTGNGGYQLYYNYVEGLTISADAYPDLPAVDIRSDGGFVVAPPSVTDFLKNGEKSGGEYTFFDTRAIANFPIDIIKPVKKRRTLTSTIGVSVGGRNDSIASIIGKLLLSEGNTDKFITEVLPAIERINATYLPPLPKEELITTFNSIVKKELERRSKLILSPIQPEGADPIEINLDRTKSGTPYSNMANVIKVLEKHPYYAGTIKYNTFRQEIEYNKKPFEEGDLVKIQYFMQTEVGLTSISKDAVYSAVLHYANTNSYDEAKDWANTLEWDGNERLSKWVIEATGITDTKYHRAVGAQWILGSVKRILIPGYQFDHALVLVGGQGIGKTSFFRIVGGDWYKSYTGAMDNKDFYLALRGALIVDLDEGAALSKAESIKMKSIITETHDEFRAPYDRVMKKYPRRFVFSMSTNDAEPFKDVTGNRRYWTVDVKQKINFKWLQENRDQIFAEAIHYFKNNIDVIEVPVEDARASQESHISEDPWTGIICKYIRNQDEYKEGKESFFITMDTIFSDVFRDESLLKLNSSVRQRIANILRGELGMDSDRKRIDGDQKSGWIIEDKKREELRTRWNTLPIELKMRDPFD